MGLTRIRAEQISDIDFKQAVRVCSTTNVTLSGGAPSSVDDVNLAAGDRVLVTGQTDAKQNGIYEVQTVGAGSNGTWVRTYDANASGEMESGMIVQVNEGTANGDTQWVLKTDDPIVLGTTELEFQRNVGGKVTVSGSPPSEPKQGDYWIDSDTGVEYIYFNDGTTSQWAEMESQYNYSYVAGNADFTQIASNVLPTSDVAYSLGNVSNRWKDAYIGNTVSGIVTASTKLGVGTTTPSYQAEIKNTGQNALLVLTRTDGAACFIEGQASRSAFGSVGASPLVLAYNSLAVISIGAGGAITVNPDGGNPFTLPTADGTSGQTLTTDGSGSVSWSSTPGPYIDDTEAAGNGVAVGSTYYRSSGQVYVRLT